MAAKITKGERDALVKIIKTRYEILREQLFHREEEIRSLIRQRIWEEHEEARKEAVKKALKIEKKMEALRDEARAVAEEVRLSGLAPTYRRSAGILVEARVGGTEVADWQVEDLERKTREEFDKLRGEANYGHLTLREQEMKLTERVYTSTFETDEAEEIFKEIPDLDKLLPNITAAEIKELSA